MTRPEDLLHNRALWDLVNEQFSGSDGLELWRRDDIVWGLFATPESQVQVLGEVAGLDVVELGCGAAHVSAWLARRGARVVAIDQSGAKLATGRAAQAEHGVRFTLLQADAEHVPLTAGCADLVVSEHGAPAWCEPDAWIGEAARILRPGGRLVFLTNSPLSAMCVPAEGGPAGTHLLRGPDDLREVRWPGGGVEHHPGHGEWIRVLGAHGFVVEALLELHAPADHDPARAAADFYGIADLAWARRWPAEDLWSARLDGPTARAAGPRRA
ncbi:MAG TPA: methyltransferase domain-containing protein [Candidatus Limnocylindrales bacterium]|nr:methyltransferase domain-containing protein [Candidatus Limnocylindrales bacterium]